VVLQSKKSAAVLRSCGAAVKEKGCGAGIHPRAEVKVKAKVEVKAMQ
jgi:hypothetical protein